MSLLQKPHLPNCSSEGCGFFARPKRPTGSNSSMSATRWICYDVTIMDKDNDNDNRPPTRPHYGESLTRNTFYINSGLREDYRNIASEIYTISLNMLGNL